MKSLLLSIIASAAVSFASMAQCSPNSAFTTPGFYPDSATGLPVACNGIPYIEVITIVSPVDTVLNTPFGLFTIPIDSVKIIGVTGLASGLSYTCQFPTCSWIPTFGNQASCLVIEGTPTAMGTTSFQIHYDLYVTLFGTPQSLTQTQGYTFEVQGCASIEEFTLISTQVTKMTDLMGREIKPVTGVPVLYHYADGSVKRVVNLSE